MAVTSHKQAAVVMPRIRRASLMMAPAPRKPMPVTTP